MNNASSYESYFDDHYLIILLIKNRISFLKKQKKIQTNKQTNKLSFVLYFSGAHVIKI